MRAKGSSSLLLICLLSLLVSISAETDFAFGQSTSGAFSGTIKDESDAVLPSATVTITHVDTGLVRTVISDDRGRYHAGNLALGNYELRVELSGFQSMVRSGIQLTIGREAVLNPTLKIGEVTETITVTGEASLVETRRAELGKLVSREKIDLLPLNGRSFQQLAFMQPGAFVSSKSRSALQQGKGAKAIDDMSQTSERTFVANLTRAQDPFDRSDNRALADFDVRHSFVVNGIYDVPFGPGRKFFSGTKGIAGKLLDGWQTTGILMIAAGAPLSVELGFDQARSGERDSQRPLLVGNSNNPIHRDNPDRYFDVNP